jgi:hypothetical protein
MKTKYRKKKKKPRKVYRKLQLLAVAVAVFNCFRALSERLKAAPSII